MTGVPRRWELVQLIGNQPLPFGPDPEGPLVGVNTEYPGEQSTHRRTFPECLGLSIDELTGIVYDEVLRVPLSGWLRHLG